MLIEIDEALAKKIFEEKQLEYCIETIKKRLDDFLDEECSEKLNEAAEKFDESDYRRIAEDFLENHDCNLSDNEQYGTAIKCYFEHLWIS